MITRSHSMLICSTLAACITGCLAWPVWGQPAGAATASEAGVNVPKGESQAGESEETDLEESLLAPVTLADVFGGRPPRPFIVSARAEYQFDSGIDNAGDFSVFRGIAGGGMLFPLGTRTAGAVGGAYSYSGYDFDDATAFGDDEAWGDVQGVHGFLIVKHLIDRNWSVIGGTVFSSVGETDADFTSSVTGGGFVGAGYRTSEDFYVQLGVNVSSQLEDDPNILPVFRVNWQIDDRWLFRAGVLETGATDTAGAGITYRFNEQWSMHGRVGYASRRFRLDDSGFAPEGVGIDRGYRTAISVTWEPNPDVQIGLIGGMVFAGDLTAEDDSGDRVFREDFDATPFISARLRWEF